MDRLNRIQDIQWNNAAKSIAHQAGQLGASEFRKRVNRVVYQRNLKEFEMMQGLEAAEMGEGDLKSGGDGDGSDASEKSKSS